MSIRREHLAAFLFPCIATLAMTPPLPGQSRSLFRDIDSNCGETVEKPVWDAYTNGLFRPGSNRVIGEGQLFLPLFQDRETLLFTDIRGQLADDGNREGNFGLGLRRMFDSEWIAGGYVFYDRRRTPFGNEFDQATVGMEFLSLDWEARANGYLPNDSSASIPGGAPQAVFSGGTIQLQGGGSAVERPYFGVDAEVGARLMSFAADSELRGFLGGFHFDNNHSGFRNISGPRARMELRLYDWKWLGPGARVVLGGELQWDAVRDTTAIGSLLVRIPLGFGGQHRRKLSAIERRMVDRIVRDVDIVTHQFASPVTSESAMDSVSGSPLGPVTIIDADTIDVPLAVASAGSGSTIFVDGSKGTIDVTSAIVAQPGQTILGGGQSIVVQGMSSSATAVFTTPGIRPFVNRSDSAGSVVEVVNQSTVRGLNVQGGLYGIAGLTDDPLTDVQIVDNHISYAADTGLMIDGDVDGTIQDNVFHRNGQHGFESGNVTGIFTGNTASLNQNTGFEIDDVNATFENNTASRNDGGGFETGDIQGSFSGNIAERNADDGFYLGDIDGTFADNTAVQNDGLGFDAGDISGVFSNNTAERNTSDGFYLRDIDGTFTDNVSLLNDGWGFDVRDVVGTFSGNRAVGNAEQGFETWDIDATFTNNSALENGDTGFEMGDINGTFSDNIASRNLGFGFESGDVTGTFSENSSTENTYDGFFLGDVDGTFSSNTSLRNGGWGFDVGDVTGVFSGNTATANADNGFETSDIDAIFTNNMSTANLLNGFDTGDLDGTFSGNTAAMNNGDGFRIGDNYGEFSGNSATENFLDGYNIGTNLGTAFNNTGADNGASNQYP